MVAVGRSRLQADALRVDLVTAAAVVASVPKPPPMADGSPATEKHLPNGDLYIKSFSGNVPHGSGKYLWSDGCKSIWLKYLSKIGREGDGKEKGMGRRTIEK